MKEENNNKGKKTLFAAGSANIAGYAVYKLWKSYSHGDISNESSKINLVPDIKDGNEVNVLGLPQADVTHGKTEVNIPFDPEVYQFYPDTCAIQSQHLILKDFGIDVTQNELINVAKMNGWYAEGYGTPPECVGKLLEYYGVGVHATEGNNIFNLVNELAQGHQVIVAVDSGELVDPSAEKFEDIITGENADHALVVVGVDTSDPENVKVIVTDPGTGNKQWAYSEKEFMDAWHDSNCMMVSTDVSSEEYQGFDFQRMQHFADFSYEDIYQLSSMNINAGYDFFEEFYNSIMENPEGWATVVEEYPNLFATLPDGSVVFVEPSTGAEIPMEV